ncbi:MAG: molybdopterin-dependent oxidoreductase [Nitriliruptorales bacterium]|nr:molybdopterin-dependent oxidoreductase [Nitriliruptorales bacterium]
MATERVPTFCPLCVSRCGAMATIEDGEFVALGPNPDHPTGQALCTKGKAAPDIVRHPDRLTMPLRRTNPKGAADPGWEELSWDEALGITAERLNQIKAAHGAEAVLFSSSSPSTTGMSDSIDWLVRLRRAFGSPNMATYMELCGWGRYLASIYTYGTPVPGAYMPDLERARCILYWGYNPSVARLVHATQTVAALRRGAKLVVVDPRRAGLASRAEEWLRVRPGTDGALALALSHSMIEHGWFDADFVTRWTSAPLLVREDTGRLLRAGDLGDAADPDAFVSWDTQADQPVGLPVGDGDQARHALRGTFEVITTDGPVSCSPAFELLAAGCAAVSGRVEEITGVSAAQVERTARLLWESRPVAYYAWSGLEQHSNATQTTRAINVLYALTGSLDQPGGNVLFTPVPTNAIDGADLLSSEQRAKAVGLEHRPLGGARFEFSANEDLFTAMLEGVPYAVHGMVNFGANLVMANGDSRRVRDALASLDFMVHTDLFMNPTAELADIVLPVTSAWEAEALRVGFEVSQQAVSHVQLRRPVADRRGQAKSDLEIIFGLATELGLGEHFFDGDLEAAWRHQLEPSGITLEDLRAEPNGIQASVATVHDKHARANGGGPAGFRTTTGRIEILSEEFAAHGYAPLPTFDEPSISPVSRPDLADEFPLVLTCAKSLHFCETQHRNIAKLRASHPDPEVELHPDTAAGRGIAKGDWVRIATPFGSVRARARLDANLDPGVVVGQHGFWQGCEELELPAADPYADDGLNLNLVLPQSPSDPIAGSSPLRASMCEVSLAS